MNEEKFKEIVSDEKCNFVESVDKMVELRTEAEKLLNTKPFTKDGLDNYYGYQTVINAMLDFHAQQSKERDNTNKIIINGNV